MSKLELPWASKLCSAWNEKPISAIHPPHLSPRMNFSESHRITLDLPSPFYVQKKTLPEELEINDIFNICNYQTTGLIKTMQFKLFLEI